MPLFILTKDDRDFIASHLTADVQSLLLRPPAGSAGLHLREVAEQIQARQKAKSKLPSWYANSGLTFPPPISVEQASSERTAAYKASLVSGDNLADLTGGMGVDTAAFARTMNRVDYVERTQPLAEITGDNLALLGLHNVSVHTGDGLDWIASQPAPVDWLYLDPARRDDRGGRVVGLADCEPDVLTYLPMLLSKARHIVLKTSPLLDIDATLRQLTTTRAVHIVAVQGEVKETLFVLGQPNVPSADVTITAVNLRENGDQPPFTFRRGDEATAPVTLADPQTYLYEPNAALLKAGAFRLAGARFGLAKLAPHSHLYTSDELVAHFPGRIFTVDASCRADRRSVQANVPGNQANLTVRNFPQSVDVLRKQLGLREGGAIYLFATTLRNGDKRLIVTHKAVI
ncbi:SAM-dependent methyltransferase [uncultured Fibrella sp.]|uniref:THUMP-like domain-containing protein n=1 Tax=uncultured Fibrella sp. TaxID=1284596 RepID=UPI0035CA59FB